MPGLSVVSTHRRGERCSPQRLGLGVAPRRVAVNLTPQAVEQVAARVAALLQGRERGRPQLLSAGELARELRVERPWVYRHRHQLGGVRIGAGPKAPWRFDYEAAVEALRRQQATQQNSEGL